MTAHPPPPPFPPTHVHGEEHVGKAAKSTGAGFDIHAPRFAKSPCHASERMSAALMTCPAWTTSTMGGHAYSPRLAHIVSCKTASPSHHLSNQHQSHRRVHVVSCRRMMPSSCRAVSPEKMSLEELGEKGKGRGVLFKEPHFRLTRLTRLASDDAEGPPPSRPPPPPFAPFAPLSSSDDDVIEFGFRFGLGIRFGLR